MGQQVIYVMTHDSIGLGEDGPTHQPVEHLASLRAMPGVQVLRPADPVEVAECWEMALQYNGPTILSLTRQSVPFLRHEKSTNNQSAKGAYCLSSAKDAKLTIVATGSEVGLATAVADELEIPANVVSMPHVEGFLSQDPEQQTAIIRPDHDIVVIEAGHPLGWNRIAGKDGLIIGVNDFGESAPYQDIYTAKGLTVPDIIDRIHNHFDRN
jgi:transketolase